MRREAKQGEPISMILSFLQLSLYIAGYSNQEVPRLWDGQVFKGSHERGLRRRGRE